MKSQDYLRQFNQEYVKNLKELISMSVLNYALVRNLEIIFECDNLISISKYDEDEYEMFEFRYKKENDKFMFHSFANHLNDESVRREIKEEIYYSINNDKEFKEVIDYISKELKKLGY